MLFIGGPRHGSDIADAPGSPIPEAGDPRATPPTHQDTFVDVATGETYQRLRLFHVLPHPITGQPDKAFAVDVWMYAALPAQQRDPALFNVLLHRWISGDGWSVDVRRLTGGQPAAPTGGELLYVAECANCADGERAFNSLGDRARWLSAHSEANPDHLLHFMQRPASHINNGRKDTTQ